MRLRHRNESRRGTTLLEASLTITALLMLILGAIDLGAAVSRQQVLPRLISDPRELLGRTDDVGEKDGGKHAVWLWCPAYAGQELFDLVGDGARVARPRWTIDTFEFYVLCSRDLPSDESSAFDRLHPVFSPVEHERWDSDRWQHVSHVGPWAHEVVLHPAL